MNVQFVYTYALETHVQNPLPPQTSHAEQRAHLQAEQQRRKEVLKRRDEDKESKQKELMRKVAPGFQASGGVLQPSRMSNTPSTGLDGLEGM